MKILIKVWRVFWVEGTADETIELSLRDNATDPNALATGIERSSKFALQWLSSQAWLADGNRQYN